MQKVRTGEYVADDYVDTRLLHYDDLFTSWESLLKFQVGGRDVPEPLAAKPPAAVTAAGSAHSQTTAGESQAKQGNSQAGGWEKSQSRPQTETVNMNGLVTVSGQAERIANLRADARAVHGSVGPANPARASDEGRDGADMFSSPTAAGYSTRMRTFSRNCGPRKPCAASPACWIAWAWAVRRKLTISR